MGVFLDFLLDTVQLLLKNYVRWELWVITLQTPALRLRAQAGIPWETHPWKKKKKKKHNTTLNTMSLTFFFITVTAMCFSIVLRRQCEPAGGIPVQTCLISSLQLWQLCSSERAKHKVGQSLQLVCVTCAALEEFVTNVESSGAAFRLWGWAWWWGGA